MLKRLVSVFLSAYIIIFVIPCMGQTVCATDNSNQLLVGDRFYAYPLDEDYGDGKTWSWNHETRILTLNGYNNGSICTTFTEDYDFKIVLAENSNNIITAYHGYPGIGNFLEFGNTIIEGPGKITINKMDDFFAGAMSYSCIFNLGNVEINNCDIVFNTNCTSGILSTYNDVTITGDTSITGDVYDWGIGANRSVVIDGDVDIKIKETKLTDVYFADRGIYSDKDNIEIKGTCNIDITAGIGIYAVGAKVNIRSTGTFNIHSDLCAVRSGNSVSISGKNTFNLYNTRHAIRADEDSVIISGTGDINISLDQPGTEDISSYSCCAISARKDITISRNGCIKITDNTDSMATGLETINGSVTILNNVNLDIDVSTYGIDSRSNDARLYMEGKSSNIKIQTDYMAFSNPSESYITGGTIGEYKQIGDRFGKAYDIIYKFHNVIVNGGASSVNEAAEGDKVTVYADGAQEGYLFDRWEINDGEITLSDRNDAVATFTMPNVNVEVTAVYLPIPTPTAAPTTVPTLVPTNEAQSELDVGDFVNRCYRVALGREADSEGYKYWVDSLNEGRNCGAQVGYGFVFSNEYLNKSISNETYVNDLYAMFFGREADSEGFNYWLNILNSGVDKIEVFAGFANSLEFYNLCGKYNIVAGVFDTTSSVDSQGGVNCFVARLYKICLGRLPDQGGQAGWVMSLISGQNTGSSVAYGFVFSSEFSNKNLNDEEFVHCMYRAFFNREADEAGFETWVNKLKAGSTHEDVFNGFAQSVEFSNLCAEYQITT